MSSPAYLWVIVLWAGLLIPAILTWGAVVALRRAAHPAPFVARAARAIAAALYGWLALAIVLGATGFLQARSDRIFPTIILPLTLPVIAAFLLLRRSRTIGAVIEAVPGHWLIAVQVYRGVGAIFLVLLGVGLMPPQFALPAGMGDVLVALAALPVAVLVAGGAPYRVGIAIAWNVLGLVDLLTAVTTGFLSSPSPLQMLAHDSPNYLITAYPLALIPAFGVPLSVILHMASLRKMSLRNPAHREDLAVLQRG